MKITVLVPTYRRTSDLARCLDALARQQRAPDEVLVVCRGADEETQAWLAIEKSRARLPLVKVEVSQGGQVAALNAGLDAVTGDIVAITDDDAAPRPAWLQRIETHFADAPDVGGVGGRDWVHEHGETLDASEQDVGRWQFPGRAIGNHHLGVGAARDVDFLKGANMSYRVSAIRGGAIRFDTRLRGTGAQVNNDMAFASAVRRAGWRLVYDPAVEVDHYPAQRFDEDSRAVRGSRSWVAIENESYNLHLVVRDEYRGVRRRIALMWLMVVGHGACLGWVNLGRARFLHREGTALQRWRAARSGAAIAKRDFATRRLQNAQGELVG
ncbi:glycosyl transferase family protein [Caballeronia sordidicola]|uniref:Glycosyl transferase family protein n=1 Tax=Caballeronia sordidicola TaxID=196367 RepID=A0A158GNJ1_CABSO|nr:glycosyltransferase family 2 protein [Caballeronia sordidicola]SAL33493.1 glycosyl transferase family protein [Caballeronia sordidicola]